MTFIDYLNKLPKDHECISKKEDFKRMCKKYGKAYIDYLQLTYDSWKEMPSNIMSEEQFKDYNGIPDYYFNKLGSKSLSEDV